MIPHSIWSNSQNRNPLSFFREIKHCKSLVLQAVSVPGSRLLPRLPHGAQTLFSTWNLPHFYPSEGPIDVPLPLSKWLFQPWTSLPLKAEATLRWQKKSFIVYSPVFPPSSPAIPSQPLFSGSHCFPPVTLQKALDWSPCLLSLSPPFLQPERPSRNIHNMSLL